MDRTNKTPSLFQRHPTVVNAVVAGLSTTLVVCLMEVSFGLLNARYAVGASFDFAGLNEPDPELGYKPRPNDSVIDKGFDRGALMYTAKYTTNEYGRRFTPVEHPERRHKFLALFGCSFAFGLCLNDDQTIAACIARDAPDYMPYNFAYQGYGPQHMLITVQRPIEREIREKEGIGIYMFLMNHVGRVIGSMYCLNNWGWGFPAYYLEGDDLKCDGNFTTTHPWRIGAFHLLRKSQTLKYFDFSWPPWVRWADVKLTARVIKQAETVFHQKWPNSAFYVFFYPDEDILRAERYMKPYLDEYGIKYIDCPDVLEGRVPPDLQLVFGHPTAVANEIVAKKLVEILGLAR